MDPCKAVATLQIARDISNDASVQLSGLINSLPKDIMEKAESIEKGEMSVEDLDKATIRDFSIRMPTKLLEMSLDDQRQNIATLQDIIRKQKEAREQLIYLLLKSRCKFGADDAAKQFLDLAETSEKLKARKRLLKDALELEGLDTELDSSKKDLGKELEKLSPLTWYQPDGEEGGDSKKQRVA